MLTVNLNNTLLTTKAKLLALVKDRQTETKIFGVRIIVVSCHTSRPASLVEVTLLQIEYYIST